MDNLQLGHSFLHERSAVFMQSPQKRCPQSGFICVLLQLSKQIAQSNSSRRRSFKRTSVSCKPILLCVYSVHCFRSGFLKSYTYVIRTFVCLHLLCWLITLRMEDISSFFMHHVIDTRVVHSLSFTHFNERKWREKSILYWVNNWE